ncbi:MAG TPA: thermonuclease family protein, partial [Vicinamibacteria bacterium]
MFAPAFLFLVLLQAPAPPPAEAAPAVAPRTAPSPQPRPSGVRVPVPVQLVSVDDGDTVQIRWPQGDLEIVRLLGIDTPETRHVEHDIPFDQSFGKEARAFAQGAFAAATQIELLRS